ncbi:MAG: hypothetical protein MRY83_10195 [Flavobacteriales bacterium]|nr:hypothetical protein [Flavobacteriales bacterium]
MKRFLKKTILLVVTFITILVLFECVSAVLSAPKESQNKFYVKYQELIPLVNSKSVVLLGDSRMEWGVNASQIKNALNFGMPGSNGLDVLKYLRDNSIFPKAILINYTPFIHEYSNYNVDKTQYNLSTYIKTWIDYKLMDNSFLYNKKNMDILIHQNQPFMLEHYYNEYGDAEILLNENYPGPVQFQIDQYSSRASRFDSVKHKELLAEFEELSTVFKEHNTLFTGIYLPVCDTINQIEKPLPHYDYLNKVFVSGFYNFHELYDSLGQDVFMDCAHLEESYNVRFTDYLIEYCSFLEAR